MNLRRASVAALWLAAALSGCVHIPTVPDSVSAEAPATVTVRDARGRLTQRETDALLKRLAAQSPDADALQRHLAIEQTLSGRPLYTGNRVIPLRDGPDAFAATFAAIHQAQHYLYLEYYILEDVEYKGEHLSDLLIERQQHGVHVDVMYDSLGSLFTPKDFFERLSAAGIHVRPFNPFRALSPFSSLNSRDHRKILVADSQLAIIGGVNLSADYQSLGSSRNSEAPGGSSGRRTHHTPQRATPAEPWHDTDLQIEGPAVRELKRLFEAHWTSQQGQGTADELVKDPEELQAAGDEAVRIIGSEHGRFVPRYYATLIAAIRSASTQIWITAAYFVPTFQERQALARAARRGIDVRLLVPSHSDSSPALAVQQSYYAGLLRAGIKIYERQDGILHSKTIVADSVWSIVGSSNFDHRSVLFNDEVDAVVIGRTTGAALEQYFSDGQQHAVQVDPKTWEQRPFTHKLRERFWRLWEVWL